MHDAFLQYAIAATYYRVVGVGLADPVTDRFCDRWINVRGVQCGVWRSHAFWRKLTPAISPKQCTRNDLRMPEIANVPCEHATRPVATLHTHFITQCL